MSPILNDLIERFYGSRNSLQQLYDLCMRVHDLPGDLVECGVAMGSGIACMKRACKNKRVWGYDSFQGIQLAGSHDSEQPGKGKIHHDVKGDLLVSSGVTVHPKSQVEEILYGYLHYKEEDFILVEGWVQHTLPIIKPGRIALLRLDMDLYDPTLFALEQLYPKLINGGILLIDDYNSCSGVKQACENYFNKQGLFWLGMFNEIQGENPAYLIKNVA